MIIPDSLYKLVGKAVAGGLLEVWTTPLKLNQAAALHVIDTPTVPQDRVLVLNRFNIFANPGAGQFFQSFTLMDIDPQSVVVGPVASGYCLNVGPPFDAPRWDPVVANYVVGPGHRLQLTATYNVGGAVNVTQALVQGWSIPRAQIQLAGAAG